MDKILPEEARLRPGQGTKVCELCMNFKAPNLCEAVEGEVAPNQVCDLFIPVEGQEDLVAYDDPGIMDLLGGGSL